MSLGLPSRASSPLGLLGRASSRRRLGLLGRASSGGRRGRRLGGAVSLGSLGAASSGRHRVIGIAGQGVVWVAPCHWDCWPGRHLAAFQIAGQGIVWVALCHEIAGQRCFGTGHCMSGHVTSRNITPCHVTCHVMSHVASRHVVCVAWHVTSHNVTSCDVFCRAASYHVMSCPWHIT